MVKIAVSAAIRQYIATGPRAGRLQRISLSGTVTDAALIGLLVPPVWIFRMLQVPQRASALYLRRDREVVRGRRRIGRPFERPCIPGIAPGDFTAEVRPQQVADKNQDARGLKEHTDRHNEIPTVPAAPRLVGVDPARHPENAGNVHKIERQMESDSEEPEMQLAEPLVVHSSGHLGVPIVEGSKEPKKNGAHNYVVKVRDHKVRCSELPVERRR